MMVWTFLTRLAALAVLTADPRSTSPTAKRGFYRLTDASDAGGVLVRTESLPMEGGNFRLVARVAADQRLEAALLVDEVERQRSDGRPLFRRLLAVVSGLVLVVLAWSLRCAMRAERKYLVTPPLWLLPDSAPYGKAPPGPATGQVALRNQPEEEEADRMQRLQLNRRKRNLVQALLGAGAAGTGRPKGDRRARFDAAARARRTTDAGSVASD